MSSGVPIVVVRPVGSGAAVREREYLHVFRCMSATLTPTCRPILLRQPDPPRDIMAETVKVPTFSGKAADFPVIRVVQYEYRYCMGTGLCRT